ncbi:hypothetical protein acdb102_37140 [Acidothermaceae bacterium B102]|nr:hypothetical protein acdb102_37140 [Acidothermaceae bacterium B102]
MDDVGGVQRHPGPRHPSPRHARGRHRAPRSRAKRAVVGSFAVVLVVALGATAGLHLVGRSSGDRVAASTTNVRPPAPVTSTPAVSTSSAEVHGRTGVSLTPSAVASTAPPSTPSPTPTPDLISLRTRAVQAVLARHAAAVLHRDEPAFEATLAPSSSAFRSAQLAVYANTAGVPFASWFYEVDRDDVQAATVPRAGQLLVAVTLRYALRGFDPQPTALREYLTFVTTDDDSGWLLASDSDGATSGERSARDLWDFGPVVVVHGAKSLVLAHPAGLVLAHVLAAAADAAVPRVTAFWGTRGWDGKVVVLVPSTIDELRQIVGTSQDLSQIAALATAEISTTARGDSAVGDRVAINPATFGTLGALGRRVVMTHEITHVATRSVTGAGMPTWLVEGIADYVGFKGTGTSARFDASELARQVDDGHLPLALPTSADFAEDADSGTALAQDYEKAWMACRFIVSRTSEASLIAFYRAVGTGQGTPAAVLRAAFADVLHTDQATFTASWQSYVAVSLT